MDGSNTLTSMSCRLIFWIQQTNNSENSVIMQAALSGEQPKRVTILFGDVQGLALDYASEKLVFFILLPN